MPVPRSYSFQNNFATFTGNAVGSNLGSARRGVFTIADHEQQTYNTTIPAGTTSFRATIGNSSDAAADLDLFVYQCTDPSCAVKTERGRSADGDSEESVTIPNPAAGTWQVLIDGFAVPSGSTTYNYVDVFANAGAGHGRSYRPGRAASRRVLVDGARQRDGRGCARGRTSPPRHGHRRHRRRIHASARQTSSWST